MNGWTRGQFHALFLRLNCWHPLGGLMTSEWRLKHLTLVLQPWGPEWVPDQQDLTTNMSMGLLSKEHTAMRKKHPKPDTEAAAPSKLDSFVSDFAGKKLDKARDAQLARIQGAVLYAVTCENAFLHLNCFGTFGLNFHLLFPSLG